MFEKFHLMSETVSNCIECSGEVVRIPSSFSTPTNSHWQQNKKPGDDTKRFIEEAKRELQQQKQELQEQITTVKINKG